MAEHARQAREHEAAPSDSRTIERDPVASGPAEKLLKLQSLAGNQAVIALLAEAQPSLEVGSSDDAAEREADRAAAAVVAGVLPPAPSQGTSPAAKARRSSVVGAEGGVIPQQAERAVQAARRGGQPLPERTRATMERALGADLSDVRTHVGPGARALNRTLSAKAFTVGNDVFFRDQLPSTDDADGKGLLAHELTHTLQPSAPGAVHRFYVETDEATKEGSIDIDGKPLHYKWDTAANLAQFEDTGKTVSGYFFRSYPVYKKKTAPKPAAAKPTPATPAAVAPAPIVLSGRDITRLDAAIIQLTDWGKLGDKVDKSSREQRRGLATEAKAMKEGRVGRTYAKFAADVRGLEQTFKDAQDRVDAARKLEADEQAATLTRQKDLATAEALDAKLLGLCGGQARLLGELRRGFGTAEKLDVALKLAPALTLQPLLSSFTGATITKLLENETDKGARLRTLQRNVVKKEDPTALLAAANNITPTQLMTLLDDTKSTTLVELAPLVKSGAVLQRMRLGAASEEVFAVNVKGMVGAGYDVAAADTAAADEDDDAFATDLESQKKTIGLFGENDVEIEFRGVKGMSGDGLGGEESAIETALAAIDKGTAPESGVVEKRVKHKNNAGHLPGKKDVKQYQEWGIKPPPDIPWPAERRLVIDEDEAVVAKRPVFYTWNHYGDGGKTPAFVRIR